LKSGEGIKPIEDDEKRRKLILSKLMQEVKGLGDGSDKEVEGFFNLLFAHIFSLHPPSSSEANDYVNTLLKAVCAPGDRLTSKYRILSNLFNTLPRTSALRLSVYQSLLALADSNDNLNALELRISDVEKWLSEWEISEAAKASFLKSITDAYTKAGQPLIAHQCLLLYVKSLPSSSQEVQAAALILIASALRLPTIFDFDPLLKLKAVLAVKDHELFGLLQIFLNNGLSEFKSWVSGHPETLELYKIPAFELEHKIRLLTLASLAFQHVGQSLPYAKIVQCLQVDANEVEKWAIDVIRAGLVSGKLSQTTQSLYIIRATSRNFEQEQWRAVEQRLMAWRTGLASILDVVTKKMHQTAAQA